MTKYAAFIGCPEEFFLLPLQSIAAHFTTSVQVNSDWVELIILWSVVVAHRGQKKSPALSMFTKELSKMEKKENNEDAEEPSQNFVEHFSMEELHYTLKRNGNRVVGSYDELSLLYKQLDRFKPGHADRNTVPTLINRGCWRRNVRSFTSTIKQTCFTPTGFVQPSIAVKLCSSNDDDGFMDG